MANNHLGTTRALKQLLSKDWQVRTFNTFKMSDNVAALIFGTYK